MKLTPPQSLVGRILWVAVGGVIALANAQGGERTILGFYPPDTAEAIGFDLSKAAIAALALWLIYRGIRPAKSAPSKG